MLSNNTGLESSATTANGGKVTGFFFLTTFLFFIVGVACVEWVEGGIEGDNDSMF